MTFYQYLLDPEKCKEKEVTLIRLHVFGHSEL